MLQNCFSPRELLLSRPSHSVQPSNDKRKAVSTKRTYSFVCDYFQLIARTKQVFNDFISLILWAFSHLMNMFLSIRLFYTSFVLVHSLVLFPPFRSKRKRKKVSAFKHVQYNQLDRQPVLLEKSISCLHTKALYSVVCPNKLRFLVPNYSFLLLRIDTTCKLCKKLFS
jgi:hypothetical protein